MTRTLATGADRRDERGFTLVELMVVLVIVGLTASAVLLTSTDGRPSVAREAERFSARLVRAREEAVLANRTIEVALSDQGYRFRTRDLGGWRPMTDGPFGPVDWAAQTAFVSVQGEGRIAFDATGASTPTVVLLTRGDRGSRVSVDSAGNVRIDAAPIR
ncbi:MAG TPA: GspH/FimT family pseudopilin [Caulobacter sp.]|nr:GspH/FimT family pseudopilin [Caulobacter sp.]